MRGRTETTDSAPRPDFPLVLRLDENPPKAAPIMPPHQMKLSKNASGGGRKKPVTQYTKDGVFVKDHPSAQAAADSIGIANCFITKVARGEQKSSKGFIWEYTNLEDRP